MSVETPYEVDSRLLNLLLRASHKAPWLAQGAELFNLANTDSPDVQIHTEVVLTVAALQRVMDAESLHREAQIAAEFVKTLAAIKPARMVTDCKRRLDDKLPGDTLREIWFRDLYRLRNAYAHGETQPARKTVWAADEHLCLASYIFPRLILARLSSLGLRQLSGDEQDQIGAFDHLLCLKTFRQTAREQQRGKWPWAECYFDATRELGIDRIIADIVSRERGSK